MENPLPEKMKRAERMEWLAIASLAFIVVVLVIWRFAWYFDMKRRPIVGLYNEWNANGFPVEVCEVSKEPYPVWNRTTAFPSSGGVLRSFVTKHLHDKLRVGQAAFIERGDASLPATVSAVSGTRNIENGLYEILLRPDDPKETIEPSYHHVSINTETIPDAIVVPIEVLRDGDDGSYVWVIEKETARIKPVEKIFSDGVYTLVKNDIGPGDLLVSAGFYRLEEGTHVDIESSSPCFPSGERR